MKKLLILGAGGHGKVCADIAELSGEYSRIAFLDDNYKHGEYQSVLGCWDIVGSFQDLARLTSGFSDFFVAIGNNDVRMSLLFKLISMKVRPAPVLIHPDATVHRHHIRGFGPGTVVCAGARVNINTVIQSGCIVNTNAVIGHDCHLAEGVQVASGCTIAGGSLLHKKVFLGIGAMVGPQVEIGENAIIGAGTYVHKSVGPNQKILGGRVAERVE